MTACAQVLSEQMSGTANRHTRLVFWLKIILPIVALTILSTLFLFARKIDFEGTLPYANVNVEDLANNPRLTAPEYSGVTQDGAAIRIAATTARPGKTASDPILAEGITALYEGQRGTKVALTAKTGSFDPNAGTLSLTGEVLAATSDGYRLQAEQMAGKLSDTDLLAEGQVQGETPFGTITAGSMRLSGPTDDHQLVFKGGVKLVYTP